MEYVFPSQQFGAAGGAVATSFDKYISEKDILVINLTYAYILIIEAKTKLSHYYQKACEQLQETMRMFKYHFGHIDQEWKIIRVLYGTKMGNPNIPICRDCDPYIITSKDDFVEKLMKILPKLCQQKPTLFKDFHSMIKDLIPPRVKLPGEITSEISNTIEKAGTAQNIARYAWTPSQFYLAQFCENYKRVIFQSGYGTGKTILMVHCALELMKKGQRVKFVLYQNKSKKMKTFLQLKLEAFFEPYIKNNLMSIINTSGFKDWLWLKNLQNVNIFIDELILNDSSNTYNRPGNHVDNNLSCPTKTSDLIDINNFVDPKLHLWIVIGGNFKSDDDVDAIILKLQPMFHFQDLKLPLRYSEQIVKFGQQFIDGDKSAKNKSGFGRGEVSVTFDVEIPNNLVKAPEPIRLKATTWDNGLKKALQNVPMGKTAVVVFDYLFASWNFNDLPRKFVEVKRPKPLVYCDYSALQGFNNTKESDVKQWIIDPGNRKKDLVTDVTLIHGFEFEVMIYVKKSLADYNFNTLMRCTSNLIVVEYQS